MSKFKLKVAWYGAGGHTRYEDTIEADDACDVLDHALPGSWKIGDYQHATIEIEPMIDKALE